MSLKHLIPERTRTWLYWRRARLFACFKKIGHAIGLGKVIWKFSLPSEVGFWADYLGTRGKSCQAEEEFQFRISPDSELQSWLKQWLVWPEETSLRVLDVGAGPLTWVGKKWDGRPLQIDAIDPLAEAYDQIMQQYGIHPPVRTKKGEGEAVVQVFGEGVFDLTFARNSLDHSYDAMAAVTSMIAATKPGGIIFLWHNQDEAEHLSYQGLHQWNFRLRNGELLVWKGNRVLNVNRDFSESLEVLRCDMEGDMIHAAYRKLK
jgi:SAM-dependent methyltransferase